MPATNQPDRTPARAGDKRAASDPLVGKWFHSFKVEPDGCRLVEWQGRITAKVDAEHYLIQTYEWWVGYESTSLLVTVADMAVWQFYDSDEHMRGWYEASGGMQGEMHYRNHRERPL